MAGDIYDWSQTPANNASADSLINWTEGQNPDTVNDSARQMMRRVSELVDDLAPTRSSTGTSNAYAVTSQAGLTGAYREGEIVAFIADRSNTGAATLNINGRGAVPLRPEIGRELASGEIRANQPLFAFYKQASNTFVVANTGYHINAMTTGLLTQSVASRLIKIGTPVLSMRATPEQGYIRLTETTQSLAKATWPELDAWLSAQSYPWGSTATHFSLPPAAGYYLRFAATSTAVDTGGARTAGSTQADQNKSHTHTASSASAGAHTHGYKIHAGTSASTGATGVAHPTLESTASVTTESAGAHTHAITVDASGGDEVRVKNVAFHIDVFASSALSAGITSAFGFNYQFDSGTAAADPGTGRIRGNHATLGSITALYISETEWFGLNIGAVLSTIATGAIIRLSLVSSQATQIVLQCTGSITDNGSYRTIPVTVLASAGSFANIDITALEFLAGASGSAGAPGPAGPVSSSGGFVNLIAAGAVGDGVANDRTALQNALNSLGTAGGGIAYLPPGIYRITQGLSVPSNVHLMGAGASSIIRPQAGAMSAQTISGQSILATIAMVGVTGAKVSRLKIDHATNSTQSNGVQVGHLNARSNECVVENIWIDGFASHQYLIYNLCGDRTTIRGNRVIGSLAGIPGTDTACIEQFGGVGCVIEGNFCKNGIQGILVTSQATFVASSCTDTVVANNVVENCYDGIYVSSGLTVADGGIVARVTVTGNVVTGTTNRGLVVSAGAGCALDAVVIANNAVMGSPANAGVFVYGDAAAVRTDVTVNDNRYEGTSIGYALQGAKGASLRDNRAQGATFYGVYVSGGANNTITGNEVSHCNQGIVLENGPTETIVSRNDILEYAAEGIVVVGAASWLDLSDNYFQRNTSTSESYCIQATATTDCVVSGNRIGHTVTLAEPISVAGLTPPVGVVKTLALAPGTHHNVVLPAIADTIVITGIAGDRTITGFAGGVVGRRFRLVNFLGNLTLSQTSSSSLLANRISIMPNDSTDLVLPAGSGAEIEYFSAVGAYWYVVDCTPAKLGAASIANDRLANMATARIKGRTTSGSGPPEDLTASQLKTMLAIAAGDVSGLATSATTDTTNASNITSGTLAAARIADSSLALAKLGSIATARILGNVSGASAAPAELTAAQVKSALAVTPSDITGFPVAALEQHALQWHSEAYIIPPTVNFQAGGASLVVNRMYHIPLFISRATNAKSIAIYVKTAIASSTVRLGLRRWNGQRPTTLLIDAGTVDTSTTGLKTLSFSDVALDPGVVMLVIWPSHSNIVIDGTPSYGALGMLGALLNAASLPVSYTYRTLTFSGGLPADETAETHIPTGNGVMPIGGIRTW